MKNTNQDIQDSRNAQDASGPQGTQSTQGTVGSQGSYIRLPQFVAYLLAIVAAGGVTAWGVLSKASDIARAQALATIEEWSKTSAKAQLDELLTKGKEDAAAIAMLSVEAKKVVDGLSAPSIHHMKACSRPSDCPKSEDTYAGAAYCGITSVVFAGTEGERCILKQEKEEWRLVASKYGNGVSVCDATCFGAPTN